MFHNVFLRQEFIFINLQITITIDIDDIDYNLQVKPYILVKLLV